LNFFDLGTEKEGISPMECPQHLNSYSDAPVRWENLDKKTTILGGGGGKPPGKKTTGISVPSM
jgi:hypothetical protein